MTFARTRSRVVRGHDLSAIAVAHRPGLIGALLIGVTTAKALAWAWELPLIGVHHLEAHLQAPMLTDALSTPLPYLGAHKIEQRF